LPAIHDTAYTRLKSSISEEELNEIYTPNLEVFRGGEIQVKIFVLGQDDSGKVVGLQTLRLEKRRIPVLRRQDFPNRKSQPGFTFRLAFSILRGGRLPTQPTGGR
jgi:Nuclease A inhibitor-like protein